MKVQVRNMHDCQRCAVLIPVKELPYEDFYRLDYPESDEILSVMDKRGIKGLDEHIIDNYMQNIVTFLLFNKPGKHYSNISSTCSFSYVQSITPTICSQDERSFSDTRINCNLDEAENLIRSNIRDEIRYTSRPMIIVNSLFTSLVKTELEKNGYKVQIINFGKRNAS